MDSTLGVINENFHSTEEIERESTEVVSNDQLRALIIEMRDHFSSLTKFRRVSRIRTRHND